MNTYLPKLTWISAFAIAMGFLESAVVIYIRAMYYKDGFQFPLRPMELSLARVEIFREAATLIMLIAACYLAGSTATQRFAFFTLAFAIWDLFYYVFLYVFLGWPESLFTWDLLFLIPLPWIGPVWSPFLICLLMILSALVLIHETSKNAEFKLSKKQLLFLIVGILLCIFSFMWDYLHFTGYENFWSIVSSKALFAEISHYVPQTFNHSLFFTGFACMSFPLLQHVFLKLKSKQDEKK
ncbi:MAG: hypothetical protein JNK73_05215 [Bacteroidia bacterium]|nr:hypothetical protein [Bacteroidia bacterium]